MAENNNLIDFNTSPETVKFVEVKKPEQTKSTTITRNGLYKVNPDTSEYTLSEVEVDVNVQPNLQFKRLQAPVNSTLEVVPDEGFDALSNVTITGTRLGTADIVPEKTEQEITPGYGYEGFTSVTVQPVTSDIDENIKPENIAEGVEILGVVGTHTGGGESDYDEIYDALEDLNAGEVKIPGAYSYYDGTIDIQGLTELGWDAEDIATFKDNYLHYAWEDSFQVSDENKALTGLDVVQFYQATIDYETYQRTNIAKFVPRSAFSIIDQSRFYDYTNAFESLSSVVAYPTLTVAPGLTYLSDEYGSSIFGSNYNLIVAPRINNFHYLTSCQSLFTSCNRLVSVPKYDTRNVSNFKSMFYRCKKLRTIPRFDTSMGTNFSKMFQDCSALVSVPPLDTHNGTSFNDMFSSCTNLERIEGIDFSNATGTLTPFGTTASTATTVLTRMIVNGSINTSINFGRISTPDFESMLSILTAANNTTNSDAKTMTWYNKTVKDQGGQLSVLKSQCETKGWTITGLTLN